MNPHHHYSVTLNFFVSPEVNERLRQIKLPYNSSFDWRNSNYIHCTLKSLALLEKQPEEATLQKWIKSAKTILDRQPSFRVKVQNLSNFPSIIYAQVHSEEVVRLHNKLFPLLPSGQPDFEGDNFEPHISLGDLSKPLDKPFDLKQNLGEFEVDQIQLVIWDLSNFDSSIIYHRFDLKK